MGEFLPEGHPLKDEVERQKTMMGGDLSGLPPGHPLLRAIEEAKRKYDEKQVLAKDGVKPADGVRRAKKFDPNVVQREARRQEDERTDKRRDSAAEVNKGIEVVLRASKELFGVVSRSEEFLATDQFSKVKAERLKRILFAVERGISECRIARV